MSDFYVPRTELAQAIYDQTKPDPILGSQSGVFLAAPRRTGKSTFLRRELVPLLEANNLLPVYVDLWSDLDADPGRLIADAIARSLDDLMGGLEKALRRHLPRSVAVGGVKVELASSQGRRDVTLSEALSVLGDKSGKDVALIIDEAQHALSTGAGRDAMFALKAARDEMNQRSGGARLLLVFTGSHRDKLAGLLRGHKDPFFGSTVTDFPKLGASYTSTLVKALNARLAADNQLDEDDVATAFGLVGHQPEILTRLLRDHALGQEGSRGLHRTVTERADALRRLRWDQHRSDCGALTGVQKAMLTVLAEDGPDFAPFTADTLRRASDIADRVVSASDAQKALDALRDKSLVWRPTRGIYALEDQDMREWLLSTLPGATGGA